MEITAKQVNELRAKTGLGMMECKKALTETAGDIEKAVEYFRKKGVKASITERAASEGRVAAASSGDNKRGVVVEINCNTDFAAKSDIVGKIADTAACMLAKNPTTDLKADSSLKEQLTAASQQTGENIQIGRTSVLETAGKIASYVYTVAGKGKIAVLIAANAAAPEDILRQVCMHIAAAKPIALTRDQVPLDLVAKEREIGVEQAKATGKPQAIAEKIAEGKLNSFFAERVLLDQEFIGNPEVFKGKVSDLLKSKGITIEKYIRQEVGQQ
jgi:elongation factor Ts